MKTVFDTTQSWAPNYEAYSTDSSYDNIEKQMNELFLVYSKIKKLEYYKNTLCTLIKDYMMTKELMRLENQNGKLAIIEMPHSHLSKDALIKLDVSEEIIELATTKKITQQLRINIR
jgi:hypothetical protein